MEKYSLIKHLIFCEVMKFSGCQHILFYINVATWHHASDFLASFSSDPCPCVDTKVQQYSKY